MARYTATSWRRIRPKVVLDRLPLHIDLSPQRSRMVMFIVAGLVWFSLPFWLFSDKLDQFRASAGPDLFVWFSGAFAAVALVTVAQGVFGLAKRRKALIDKDVVSVTGRSVLGRESWQEPLARFSGIAHREGRMPRKNNPATYQIIELIHPDPQKTILLDVMRGKQPPHARAAEFANALRLPLIDEAGGVVVAQGSGGRPLRERAGEGSIAVAYDPSAPVPAGLTLSRRKNKTLGSDGGHAGDALVITINAPRIRRVLLIGAIALPLLIAIGAVLQNGLQPGVFVVLLIVAAAVWFWRQDAARPRVLEITREEIILNDAFGAIGGPGKVVRLRHDEIEQVYASKSRSGVLIIAGKTWTLATGGGLSQEALEWLKGYLTAAIANA